MAHSPRLQAWIDLIEGDHDMDGLAAMIAEEAVLWSPVVHTPQHGKAIVTAYLWAAGQTIANEHFRYLRVFEHGQSAVLEFETQMDGLYVNGVDMIDWNEADLILQFKVMVRPLKAVQVVHQHMAQMLEKAGRP